MTLTPVARQPLSTTRSLERVTARTHPDPDLRPDPHRSPHPQLDARLRLSGVRKVFASARSTVPVLDGIDLTVAAGEFVAVVGASGCGKSTLLSLIAGLDQPTAGTVRVTARPPALLFQQAGLFPWLTAARNVELALRLRGVGRGQRRLRARVLLDTVGLAEMADRPVFHLSGGQQQRVALARVLAQDAELLLLDEPFAALDAGTRELMHAELVAARRRTGMSVVMVTHDVREAVRLADRVLLLSSRPGRVLAEWSVPPSGPLGAGERELDHLADAIGGRLRAEIARRE